MSVGLSPLYEEGWREATGCVVNPRKAVIFR